MLVSNFIFPLALTIIIECAVVVVLGYRGKLLFIAIAVVNLITNPFMNFIGVLLYSRGLEAHFYQTILLLELAVVLAEWLLLSYAFPERKKALLVLSAAMNSASFLAGLLIFQVIL